MIRCVDAINELYAFLVGDKPGDEEIPVIQEGNAIFPLITDDERRLARLRVVAQRGADTTGKRVTLARFDSRHNLEVIGPLA
jgi:hypothetical protein